MVGMSESTPLLKDQLERSRISNYIEWKVAMIESIVLH